MFTYARNSCWRNHHRYTICGSHYREGHGGDWKTCANCRDVLDTEDYVSNSTSIWNFLDGGRLENPPKFDETKCSQCGVQVKKSLSGYSMKGDDIYCNACTTMQLPARFRQAGGFPGFGQGVNRFAL